MALKFAELRSVLIICDRILKDRVLGKLDHLGATGYTWWEVHGKGEHDSAIDIFSGLVRVHIEIFCGLDVAEEIVAYCHGHQFHGMGMTVGVTPLFVLEEDVRKFTGS
jgi:nitrogen regulatory protein PII